MVVTGADDSEDPIRPPLPQEDRLWRHPSEVAASLRAEQLSAQQLTTTVVSTIRTPLRHALGLATIGAVSGALLVSGLFLTIGRPTTTSGIAAAGVTTFVPVDPIVPILQAVPAEHWPAAVAENAAPGIAKVVATSEHGPTTGSGVVFRSDGYLLTSRDLVEDASSVEVNLSSGEVVSGEVLGIDKISGLAVVRVRDVDTAAAGLAIVVPPPQVGDVALTLTSDPKAELDMATISALDVSVAVEDQLNLHGLLQLTTSMPRSGSGAGVVDDTGSVIGIVVDVGSEHATYAVPIGYARKIAEDLIDHGAANHSWLGIRGLDLDNDARIETGLDGAVRLQSLIADGPAQNAGLSNGDLIVAIEGRQVTSMSELILELRRHVPGETIEVTALIDGKKYRKSVTLDTRSVDNTT